VGYELYRQYRRDELQGRPGEVFVVGRPSTFIAKRELVTFPDRSSCSWPDCDPRLVEESGSFDLFVEREGGYQYLGAVLLVVFGRDRLGSRPSARLHLLSPLSRERWLELQQPLPAWQPPWPEEAIAALTAQSTSADRIAAVETFVERWFGPVRDGAVSPAMPAPLAALHRLARAHPHMIAQNSLVAPELVDGRTAFYVENQGVCSWKHDATGDDPAVWFRMNEPGERWQREPELLSGFVVQLVLFEAIWTAAFGGSAAWLEIDEARRLRERFTPLPLGTWCWGPTSFHARDGALLVMTANDDAFSAFVAARHPAALDHIADLVDDAWEHVAF
jgi:hypothetical protein